MITPILEHYCSILKDAPVIQQPRRVLDTPKDEFPPIPMEKADVLRYCDTSA